MSEKNICSYCSKIFSKSSNCNRHILICKYKSVQDKLNKDIVNKLQEYKDENERLKLENERLKGQIEILNKCVDNWKNNSYNYYNNSNNNISITIKQIVSNLDPIDFEEIKSSMKDFTNKYIDQGIVGFAKFLCDHGCNKKIITTDYSRNTIAYRTTLQKFIKDPACISLINTVLKMNNEEILDKVNKRREYYRNRIKDNDEDEDAFNARKRVTELKILAQDSINDESDMNIKKISQILRDYGVKMRQSLIKDEELIYEDETELENEITIN